MHKKKWKPRKIVPPQSKTQEHKDKTKVIPRKQKHKGKEE